MRRGHLSGITSVTNATCSWEPSWVLYSRHRRRVLSHNPIDFSSFFGEVSARGSYRGSSSIHIPCSIGIGSRLILPSGHSCSMQARSQVRCRMCTCVCLCAQYRACARVVCTHMCAHSLLWHSKPGIATYLPSVIFSQVWCLVLYHHRLPSVVCPYWPLTCLLPHRAVYQRTCLSCCLLRVAGLTYLQ